LAALTETLRRETWVRALTRTATGVRATVKADMLMC
jgi:hypothetical protein